MKIQKAQGSILAYSLVILAMMFAIVGTISTVTILEKKSAGASQSSAQAFQIADSLSSISKDTFWSSNWSIIWLMIGNKRVYKISTL